MCQPELKYINLALINIHYLIVDKPDGGEAKLHVQNVGYGAAHVFPSSEGGMGVRTQPPSVR